MDFQTMSSQYNALLNKWLQATKEYFIHLSQNEMYGWGAFGVGLILFIVGIILL